MEPASDSPPADSDTIGNVSSLVYHRIALYLMQIISGTGMR